MKRFFTLILLSLLTYTSFSQIKVKENSFHRIQNYVMDDKDEHMDGNYKPMALIKISTENINAEERNRLYFKGNRATDFNVESKIGELYLYISAEAATVLEIKHPDYGKTMFTFPEPLCDFCAYELVVQYIPIASVSEPNPTQQKQYLIVKSDQPDALIYIDDEPINTGEASKLVDKGTSHKYSIRCKMYYEDTGTVIVNDRTIIERKLRPNFGYINISTTPEQGAKIFVDDDYLGLSPIKTDKLRSGPHTVRVMKDMYKMVEQSFIVTDGQTLNATLDMSNNFANVTVTTDSLADIYIDEGYKGKGQWIGRLSDGSHIFEARKVNHKTTKKSEDLLLGETRIITIDAPTPIYGSIDINSSPINSNIYIDGKMYGQTPFFINEILIGEHELKLEKTGFKPLIKTINIKESEILTLNETMLASEVFSDSIALVTTESKNSQQEDKIIENKTFTVNGVSFTMIAIEGGSFRMGATSEQSNAADNDEKPIHTVVLSDYHIGETEVTQELWQAVMGNNPSYFKGNQRPVESISWNDCLEFINRLNEKTGEKFRFPTEAEWEYAARGGNMSELYKYSGSNTIENVTWYKENCADETHDVKTKSPNELGIYDMSGNVWEWCQDWYESNYYDKSPRKDPQGPSFGSYRIIRGGGWFNEDKFCRVSDRGFSYPDSRVITRGLRLSL